MTDLERTIRDMVRAIVKDELAANLPLKPEHISVAEYARRWSLSGSTVRKAIREKRLDVTRIGTAIRIAPDAEIRPAVAEPIAEARSKLAGHGVGVPARRPAVRQDQRRQR